MEFHSYLSLLDGLSGQIANLVGKKWWSSVAIRGDMEKTRFQTHPFLKGWSMLKLWLECTCLAIMNHH